MSGQDLVGKGHGVGTGEALSSLKERITYIVPPKTEQYKHYKSRFCTGTGAAWWLSGLCGFITRMSWV